VSEEGESAGGMSCRSSTDPLGRSWFLLQGGSGNWDTIGKDRCRCYSSVMTGPRTTMMLL
jgi:hypothetical protein